VLLVAISKQIPSPIFRRFKELQREHNRKLEAMREQLEETARHYESEIQGLQQEKQQLQQEITNREESFKRKSCLIIYSQDKTYKNIQCQG
jgi:phage host-nuclease inhibitor protein Gam